MWEFLESAVYEDFVSSLGVVYGVVDSQCLLLHFVESFVDEADGEFWGADWCA